MSFMQRPLLKTYFYNRDGVEIVFQNNEIDFTVSK